MRKSKMKEEKSEIDERLEITLIPFIIFFFVVFIYRKNLNKK